MRCLGVDFYLWRLIILCVFLSFPVCLDSSFSIHFANQNDEKLIEATDLEEASFPVSPTLEMELMDYLENTVDIPATVSITDEEVTRRIILETDVPPPSIHVGTLQQAQLASQGNKKTPPKAMVPACSSSATSHSTSSGSHHQKSYPSPLKRTQRPRKRRPKAANKTHIPHPLIPNLSRPMKAKYSTSHSHLPKFPVQ